MPLTARTNFQRSPWGAAPPGSARGAQARAEFIAAYLTLFPGVRLYVPRLTDGTGGATFTEASRQAATVTTVGAHSYAALGSGVMNTLNGTTSYLTMPDAADLSQGDGTNDQAFAVMALWNQTTNTGVQSLVEKADATTGTTQNEWALQLNSGKLRGVLYDDSAAANIGRTYNTALATATNCFGGFDYDGTRVATGVRTIAFNGTVSGQIDDTNVNGGTYTAMENKTSVLYIGADMGAAAVQRFLIGSIGFAAVVSKRPSLDEWFTVKQMVNFYWNLSL